MASASLVLEARGISKKYRRGTEDIWALQDVNLPVPEGTFLSITGPSGCGKTTLLAVLGALEVPTNGEVLLGGQNLVGLKEEKLAEVRRHKIGFVFQSFYLLDHLTALENVALPLRFKLKSRAEQRERAQELLAKVGLQDRMNHFPRELSGGQQQRVAIARAIANDPDVILADEPTGNLDGKATRQILDIFHHIHAAGQTLLVVTHDPAVADEAQHQIRLQDGQIVESTL